MKNESQNDGQNDTKKGSKKSELLPLSNIALHANFMHKNRPKNLKMCPKPAHSLPQRPAKSAAKLFFGLFGLFSSIQLAQRLIK